MEPLQTYFDKSAGTNILTRRLMEIYGGELRFLPNVSSEYPWVIINFVMTIDGHTSFGIPGQSGGGHISAFNLQDQLIMGILRALADGVMVGANTLREEPEHLWTPAFIVRDPELQKELRTMRTQLGKIDNPRNMFVTRSGNILAPGQQELPAALRTPGIEPWIVTTAAGAAKVRDEFAPYDERPNVLTVGEEGNVDLLTMLRRLRQEMDIKVLLVEGGETFAGEIINAQRCDDLFLTIAPQIIGTTKERPNSSIVGGFRTTPETSHWFNLLSSKERNSYEYKRYGRR